MAQPRLRTGAHRRRRHAGLGPVLAGRPDPTDQGGERRARCRRPRACRRRAAPDDARTTARSSLLPRRAQRVGRVAQMHLGEAPGRIRRNTRRLTSQLAVSAPPGGPHASGSAHGPRSGPGGILANPALPGSAQPSRSPIHRRASALSDSLKFCESGRSEKTSVPPGRIAGPDPRSHTGKHRNRRHLHRDEATGSSPPIAHSRKGKSKPEGARTWSGEGA